MKKLLIALLSISPIAAFAQVYQTNNPSCPYEVYQNGQYYCSNYPGYPTSYVSPGYYGYGAAVPFVGYYAGAAIGGSNNTYNYNVNNQNVHQDVQNIKNNPNFNSDEHAVRNYEAGHSFRR